jgi:phage terminase small subunit
MPSGLSKAAQAWWRAVADEYDLLPGDIHLVEGICRSLDTIAECRKATKRDGVTVLDRHGQVRVHPLLIEERLQRELIRRALATLRFEAPDLAEG